jgi:hypothetical protein
MRGGIAPRGGGAPPSVGGRGGGVAAPAAAAASSSGGASKDKDVHHLAKTISCHAWSGDRTRLALCPNDNTVEIWQFDGAAWNKEFVLNEVRQKREKKKKKKKKKKKNLFFPLFPHISLFSPSQA